MESDGKVYVPSGYMRSFLGRIWKEWAFEADEGDGFGVARIDGVRYERKLVRVEDPGTINRVARKLDGRLRPSGLPLGAVDRR